MEVVVTTPTACTAEASRGTLDYVKHPGSVEECLAVETVISWCGSRYKSSEVAPSCADAYTEH